MKRWETSGTVYELSSKEVIKAIQAYAVDKGVGIMDVADYVCLQEDGSARIQIPNKPSTATEGKDGYEARNGRPRDDGSKT